MQIGINTYGLSKYLIKDFNGTLEQLKKAGISAIEPMVIFAENEKSEEALQAYQEAEKMQMTGGAWPRWMAGEKIQAVRDAGLQIRSVHMYGPGWKQPLLDQAVVFAKDQKIQYYVLSLNESSIEKVKEEIPGILEAAKVLKENGVELLIHNHETELQDDQGTCVLEVLLEEIPELRLELDVGWVKFAGKNCSEIMRKYKERVRIIHFKDISEDASPKNRNACFTAIGEGSIPLAEIIKESKNMKLDEVGYVIDQDHSSGDMMRDVCVGVRNITGCSKASKD